MPSASSLFAATLLAASGGAAAQADWTLVMLDTSNGGVCLDGTPGAFYFRPGTGSGADKWIVHLQGGGWCISPEDCVGRANSSLGSSSGWPRSGPPTADGGAAGFLSDNPTTNPQFYNWNVAYLGYCDGGSYAGAVAAPVVVGSATIYYRGHFILESFLRKLLAVGVATASELIFKGCSAGGLATYLHADYVSATLKAANPALRVVAAPGAGFFLDMPGYDGVYHYRPHYQWVAAAMNVTGFVDADCVSYYSAQPDAPLWKCFCAEYTLPFITTPLFVSNSMADAWAASNIMALPCNPEGPPPPRDDGRAGNAATFPVGACNASAVAYLNSYRQRMLDSLAPVLSSRTHGAFLQECFVHVVEDVDRSWNGTLVAGQTQAATFQRWYAGAGPAGAPIAVDGPWGGQATCYGNAWWAWEARARAWQQAAAAAAPPRST